MKLINHPGRQKLLGMISVMLVIFLTDAGVQAAANSKSSTHLKSISTKLNQKKKLPLQPKRVASFLQLKRLLAAKTSHGFGDTIFNLTNTNAMFAASAADTSASVHSETNVQVQGVDEGDITKTDGEYIYRIQMGKVYIIHAKPASSMEIVSTLQLGSSLNPTELYVHGDQLVIVGLEWRTRPVDNQGALTKGRQSLDVAIPFGESYTFAQVYNIADRAKPVKQKEIAFSGNYLSSRKMGNSIYLVGRKYPDYFYTSAATSVANKSVMTPSNTLPHISDSAVNGGKDRVLALNNIYYFPGFVEPDYVLVTGFNLNALGDAADIKAYLGGGEIAYASAKNLYLSAADYSSTWNTPVANQPSSVPFTHLYKFALDNGKSNFHAAGEVPGVVLNSFSMDEHNDYFRIATTANSWSADQTNIWNNLYVLDNQMKTVGRLEHLAEGERIYSARFVGDRGYLVTFQQVDPLFAIDLSTPTAPKVLGELKIPGFSNYLHPYDENHLLGIGQDTEETSIGLVTKGVKLALFDVTDVSKPSQIHSLSIGARGSYSPVQYDHKALLFDKGTGLLGFPITETSPGSTDEWNNPVVFQGAHVYKVSLINGFQKLAAISHPNQNQGGNYWWWYQPGVDRLLTIEDQLYTLSNTRVQANNLTEFEMTGFLDLPVENWPQNPENPCSGPAVDCVPVTNSSQF